MGSSHYWLTNVLTIVLLCVSASVARHIHQEFDLDTAAAEPRPIFIETGPSAEALPLISSVDSSNSGPVSDASQKVEKVLRPALSFSYNEQVFL